MSVADKAQLQAAQAALVLPDGHQVRQHLAGMAIIRQAVDHGNGAVSSQVLHLLLGKGTDHNAVQIPGQHPGGILHRFSPADLQIVGAEEQGHAPQLIHAHLKGDPGPGGRFLKDHPQGLALEMMMGNAVFLLVFQLIRQVQNVDDLLAGKVP